MKGSDGMSKCYLCPRACGADRATGERGFCGMGDLPKVSRASLHFFEEPVLSGTRGAGTVFFSGCSLRCVYCQNREISRGGAEGRTVTPAELADIFLRLQAEGAHNIDLVTPTHFADKIREALILAKPSLKIPVVYNSSGYESVDTLKSLEGLIDIYLPDFKYFSSELAAAYSYAPDYRSVAEAALTEMHRQVGAPVFDGDGMLLRGIIVRHLVLPASRKDSIALLRRLAEILPVNELLLSLMSQYTPDFAADATFDCLKRRVTSFEYSSVLNEAERLGFEGFMQGRASASADYTPDFLNSAQIT